MPFDTFWDDTPIFFYSRVFPHLWDIKNASICTSVICPHSLSFLSYFSFAGFVAVTRLSVFAAAVHGLLIPVASLVLEDRV